MPDEAHTESVETTTEETATTTKEQTTAQDFVDRPTFESTLKKVATQNDIAALEQKINSVRTGSLNPDQTKTIKEMQDELKALKERNYLNDVQGELNDIYDHDPALFHPESREPLFPIIPGASREDIRRSAAQFQTAVRTATGSRLKDFEQRHQSLGGMRVPVMTEDEYAARENELREAAAKGDANAAGAMFNLRRMRAIQRGR